MPDLFQSLICDRQVPIEETHAPIAVESAFGGLGLYRLSAILDAAYIGLDIDGSEYANMSAFTPTSGAAAQSFIYFRV